jgi:hypothetical protein
MQPVREALQVLPVGGQNGGLVELLLITSDHFACIEWHAPLRAATRRSRCIAPQTWLMLDPNLRIGDPAPMAHADRHREACR